MILDREYRPFEPDHAIGDQHVQPVGRPKHGLRACAVPRADLRQVDTEVAHDPFDDVGAQPVVGRQRVAFPDRQVAPVDPLAIRPWRGIVLDVALVEPSDGARAEARKMQEEAGELLRKYEAELDRVNRVAAEERR